MAKKRQTETIRIPLIGRWAAAPDAAKPADDPWAHRAQGMRCATCMWFVAKGGAKLGRCRRHAPTMSGYPVVYPTDWCGDHKLDETKLPQ